MSHYYSLYDRVFLSISADFVKLPRGTLRLSYPRIRQRHRQPALPQRVSHSSTEFVRLRRRGRSKEGDAEERNFYGGLPRKHERFQGIDCATTHPTPRTLTPAEGLPLYTEDLISEYPGSGFLQFWTVSAVFELRQIGAGDDSIYGRRAKLQRPESESSSVSSGGSEWVDVANSDGEDGGSEDLPAPYGTLGERKHDGIDSDSDDDGGLLDDFDPDKQPGVKLIIGGKSGRAILLQRISPS